MIRTAVRLTNDQLYLRGEEIRGMLIPITRKPGGPAWNTKASSSECFFGTHDGSPAGSDYRNWFFATVVPDLKAQYFERWLKFEEQDQELWYLERAYLNIHRLNRTTRQLQEIVCLHCDPECFPHEELKTSDLELYKKLEKQAQYKHLPHLHVSMAEQPFPHAHIALFVGQSEFVMKSIESLSKAMRHVVQMLRDEVFDAINS